MNKSTDCAKYKDWIFGQEQAEGEDSLPRELDDHLKECAECRHEQRSYTETLEVLGELTSVEPSRHFFVYEEPSRDLRWSNWWRPLLSPGALAAAACLLMLIALGAIASNLQLRSDGTSLTIGLGSLPVLAQPRVERDPELLRADFRRLLTEELSSRERQVVNLVRAEIAALGKQIEQAQGDRFDRVLASFNDQLGQQFEERDEILSDNLQSAAVDIYQTLSAHQQQDLRNLNIRLGALETNGQIQGTQTEVLMATVMQLAQRQE